MASTNASINDLHSLQARVQGGVLHIKAHEKTLLDYAPEN